MTSTRDQSRHQWLGSNNDSDLLNLDNAESAGLDLGLGQTLEPKNFDPLNLEIPDVELANLFPSSYEDIDDFLTQELKDLDIPMIPQRLNTNTNGHADLSSPARCDTGWNRDINLPLGTPQKSHKRGPSGTAIFGFANHNKQLSLTKNNFDENTLHGTSQARAPNSSYDAAIAGREYQAQNNNLNSLILKQQEELRLALERQQVMNAQLEEQLRSSQRQQQQLQMALKEQEYAAQHLAVNVSPAKTPSSRTSHLGEDGKNIIVTSNSKSGGYKFPAQQRLQKPIVNTSKNGVISPVSGTSMNGSPNRKNCDTRHNPQPLNLNTLNNFSDSGEDYSSPENYFGPTNLNPKVSVETVQRMSKYFEQVNAKNATNASGRLENTNPITPQNRILVGGMSSTSSSPRASHHRAKESISSSASTIPQLCDDDDRHNHVSGSTNRGSIGLGIRPGNEVPKRKYLLNRPPPLELLPTIPGSSENTPMNKKHPGSVSSAGLPQKHVFQHTPTKATIDPSNVSYSSSRYPASRPVFKTLNEDLRPPSEHERDHEDEDGDEGPESEFKYAQTPSPILRSQGRFEDSSPYLDHEQHYEDNCGQYDDAGEFHPDHDHLSHNCSPLKITKKPTTLPPGEIDRYVQELSDKSFECLYPGCGKTFRRRYNIRSHIQTHLEDRPYICDYEGCDKAFVRNHDLVRHKKIHAEKSFACPCGKKFVREDALIVHRCRMICVGGKKFNNVVIKKSPRRRGRPRKDGTFSVTSSPVKDSITRHNNGTIALQMEEQLQRDMIENGLLRPTYSNRGDWSER
ncbi:LAFA_0E04302g1_1 [Lachancea sp. 'fantastica']|nr:LAFA_0E04302g1_1 [Lachancea sp. 'fantastica']